MGKKRRGWFDRTKDAAPAPPPPVAGAGLEERPPDSGDNLGQSDPRPRPQSLLGADAARPPDSGDNLRDPDPGEDESDGDDAGMETVPVRAQCQCAGRMPQIHVARAVVGRSNFPPAQVVITYRCPRCKAIVPLTAEQLGISPN
jgi:hypothetical protein